MDLALVVALSAHALGLVIAVGYYGTLGRVVIPSLERSLQGVDLARTLAGVEHRALPVVLLAIALFTLSGTYLLVASPSYAGLGQFFDNGWSVLMLVKHGIIVALVGAGVIVDRSARRLTSAANEIELHRAIRRVRYGAETATAMGAIAIILTAMAQAAA
jgi:uncharacterized membrane protein